MQNVLVREGRGLRHDHPAHQGQCCDQNPYPRPLVQCSRIVFFCYFSSRLLTCCYCYTCYCNLKKKKATPKWSPHPFLLSSFTLKSTTYEESEKNLSWIRDSINSLHHSSAVLVHIWSGLRGQDCQAEKNRAQILSVAGRELALLSVP